MYVEVKINEYLISIGTIGLIKAIESYKVDKGTKLATYAARCIENENLTSIVMHIKQVQRLHLLNLFFKRTGITIVATPRMTGIFQL